MLFALWRMICLSNHIKNIFKLLNDVIWIYAVIWMCNFVEFINVLFWKQIWHAYSRAIEHFSTTQFNIEFKNILAVSLKQPIITIYSINTRKQAKKFTFILHIAKKQTNKSRKPPWRGKCSDICPTNTIYVLTLYIKLSVEFLCSRRGAFDTIVSDKVRHSFPTGRWLHPGIPAPSTNKTDHHWNSVESDVKHKKP